VTLERIISQVPTHHRENNSVAISGLSARALLVEYIVLESSKVA
jgi:hypothetical protein